MWRGSAAALMTLALAAVAAGAQDVPTDCRCVGPDGEEIERCRCARAPDLRGLMERIVLRTDRPRLGISLDPGQSARNDAEGVRVADVLEGGPAEEAGLRAGDVITTVDGVSLTAPMDAEVEADFDLDRSAPVQRLLAFTRALEPGTPVEVEYLRDGRRQTTMVVAEDLSDRWGWGSRSTAWTPDVERLRGWPDPWLDDRGTYRFRLGPGPDVRLYGRGGVGGLGWREAWTLDGVDLAPLNPRLGAYFGAEEGVLVLDAGRSRLGLEAGDVILRIGSRDVDTPERFRRILSSYGDDEDIDFHVVRDGREIVVTGRLRY